MLRWWVMNSMSLGESRSDSLEAGMLHWGNDAEYIGTASADEEALALSE